MSSIPFDVISALSEIYGQVVKEVLGIGYESIVTPFPVL